MYRKTYVRIDESVLQKNVENIRRNYPDYQTYFGVVKGNAYGHGMHIVNALIAGGVNYLAVATLEEAAAVREFNREIPILCLEPIAPDAVADALALKVTLTVDSLSCYKQLHAQFPNEALRVHIKLDTGMNRLGIKHRDELDALFALPDCDNIQIEGIYTHLATGGTNDVYYDRQLARFRELTRHIDLSLIPIVHIDRSLTMVRHGKPDFANGVRLGICMYGFAQSLAEPVGWRKLKYTLQCRMRHISPAHFGNTLQLNTAFTLYSTVLAVKDVKKGEFVGYGAGFIAKEDLTVATVAIGYYDGMRSDLRQVFIGGQKCEILGALCMDMTAVHVPHGTAVGDRVEIFGQNISVKSAAAAAGTGAYKLLTGITSRVPRLYGDEEFYL